MERKLAIPIVVLILMGLVLSVMIVGGCAAATRPVGPGEPVGPQEVGGPQGPVGPQDKVGPQETIGPQEAVGPHEPVGQREGIGPADPIVLVARVLKLVGLATQEG